MEFEFSDEFYKIFYKDPVFDDIYTSENKTTKNVKKRIRNHNNHNNDIKAMIKLHEEDKKERKEFEDRMINILQELVHKL